MQPVPAGGPSGVSLYSLLRHALDWAELPSNSSTGNWSMSQPLGPKPQTVPTYGRLPLLAAGVTGLTFITALSGVYRGAPTVSPLLTLSLCYWASVIMPYFTDCRRVRGGPGRRPCLQLLSQNGRRLVRASRARRCSPSTGFPATFSNSSLLERISLKTRPRCSLTTECWQSQRWCASTRCFWLPAACPCTAVHELPSRR